ncbi:hypothetical protein V6N12_068313 [Hibiscus sabdariffa]|uniref:Uncharacterized protein n=1 Tax=Hibiscus sabdariffa TaxID=183260 RepID=A0ABR2FPR2_9ROSI
MQQNFILRGRYSYDSGYKKVTDSSPRSIKYKQDKQLFGLRDKPVTQKTLCRDLNSSRDFCRGRTRCLCRDIPFVILFKQIVEALAKIKSKH